LQQKGAAFAAELLLQLWQSHRFPVDCDGRDIRACVQDQAVIRAHDELRLAISRCNVRHRRGSYWPLRIDSNDPEVPVESDRQNNSQHRH
jgi:hypothetical protein